MHLSQGLFMAFVLLCTVNISTTSSIYYDGRQGFGPARAVESVNQPYISQSDDLQAAATGHHYGRVQIKVYRGPDTHGDHHEHFAPHGYWVKQPADADHHH